MGDSFMIVLEDPVCDQNSARITQEFFVLQQQKYTKQGCLNGSDTSPSFVFEHAVARITPINYWMMVEHGPQFHLHTLSWVQERKLIREQDYWAELFLVKIIRWQRFKTFQRNLPIFFKTWTRRIDLIFLRNWCLCFDFLFCLFITGALWSLTI